MNTRIIYMRGFGWRKIRAHRIAKSHRIGRRATILLLVLSLVLLWLIVASGPLQAQNSGTVGCNLGELPNDGVYRPLGDMDGCMLRLPLEDGVVLECLYKDAQVLCPMI
jgi:hypothetical protein